MSLRIVPNLSFPIIPIGPNLPKFPTLPNLSFILSPLSLKQTSESSKHYSRLLSNKP